MKILSKVMTADAIMVSGECYVVGAELNHTTTANLALYNAASAVGAQLLDTLRVSATNQFTSIMFPMPGIKCDNVYSVKSAGAGTLYYYY